MRKVALPVYAHLGSEPLGGRLCDGGCDCDLDFGEVSEVRCGGSTVPVPPRWFMFRNMNMQAAPMASKVAREIISATTTRHHPGLLKGDQGVAAGVCHSSILAQNHVMTEGQRRGSTHVLSVVFGACAEAHTTMWRSRRPSCITMVLW